LENWITGFLGSKLPQPINMGFTLLMSHSSTQTPKSRSSKPDQSPTHVAYETLTGNSKLLTKSGSVFKKSTEELIYIMQMLCIAKNFAKRAGFQVFDDSCTHIGVIGGEHIWSEFGVYSSILGPDVNDHEVECQGLSQIMSAFPEFDLRPLHYETYLMMPMVWQEKLPYSIGGDGVKLLIGIQKNIFAITLYSA
jgi:hypothetical protein